MARALLDLEVSAICCTPHTADWARAGDAGSIASQVKQLQAELDARGIDLKLLPGAEAYLTPSLPADVERKAIATLNGTSYLLLEFPYDFLPEGFTRVVFDLQVRGLRPVIAHPERIAPIAHDPNILYELVRRGCLGQLTAMSLSGGFGPRIREVSELMLDHNMVHLIASDAHDARPGSRLFALPQARESARRIVGPERSRALFEDTPARIIGGEVVERADPVEYKRRFSFLKAFR
jgi:protein-tyrosine phosphatase